MVLERHSRLMRDGSASSLTTFRVLASHVPKRSGLFQPLQNLGAVVQSPRSRILPSKILGKERVSLATPGQEAGVA